VSFTFKDEFVDLQPLLQELSSQMIFDPERSTAVHSMLARINAHSNQEDICKHPTNKNISLLQGSVDGDVVVTGSDDGRIAVWSVLNELNLVCDITSSAGIYGIFKGSNSVQIHVNCG
jgi:WD40 repeat protein